MPHDPGGKRAPPWPADSQVSALFGGPDDCYRYCLQELWDASLPMVLWVMMNPSVAGIEHADPTLIKTGKFSRAWGFGGQLIGNIFAYRATDPKRLLRCSDPIGPDNDLRLAQMAGKADELLFGYGRPPRALRGRGRAVARLLSRGRGAHILRLGKNGDPWHPLYLPDAAEPFVWRP